MEKIDSFFQAARSVRLSRKERSVVLGVLQGLMGNEPVRNWLGVRHRTGMEFLKPLIDRAHGISLSKKERAASWEWILARQPEGSVPVPPERLIVRFLDFLQRLHLIPAMAVALVFVLGIGATVTVAAESSLPGEFLYPVKVGMNEPIVAALTFSEEKRARFEARRANRRLEEAEALALNASLKPEMAAALQQRLKAHSVKLKRSLALMRERGQTDAADALDMEQAVSVSAHESVLVRLAQSRTQYKTEIAAILDGVRSEPDDLDEGGSIIAMENVDALSMGLAPMIASKIADGTAGKIDQRLERTRQKIDESKAFIESSKDETANPAIDASEAKLMQAESLLDQAQTEMLKGNTDDALVLRKASMVEAEEARMLFKIESALKNDTPPPVTKSQEPRTTVQEANARLAADVQIRHAKESIDKLKKMVAEGADRSDDAIREARRKLLNAEELLKKTNAAYVLDQWDDVQSLSKRAETAADKARNLLISGPLEFQPEADMEGLLQQ